MDSFESAGRACESAAKILVLDDEPCIVELLSELLGVLGYETRKCGSPREALEALRREAFDVVLSDFRMPQMNGEQFFAAAVAQSPELSDRIVFLTGDSLSDETQFFLRRTGNPHLSKPFLLEKVQEVISEVVARRKSGACAAA